MEELSKLSNILKRKKSSVSYGVQYWLYFKRHILEKTEIRHFFEKNLSYNEFKELVESKANIGKFGPSFCRRRKSETNKRNKNDLLIVIWQYYLALLHPDSPVYVSNSKLGGIGIFLKNNVDHTTNKPLFKEHLYGLYFEVGDEFEELELKGYSSLYEDKKQFIFCGPLSLVNHQCGSSLCFSKPNKTNKEEFDGLNEVHIKVKTEEYCNKKESEILIDYFPENANKVTFNTISCKCSACSTNKRF